MVVNSDVISSVWLVNSRISVSHSRGDFVFSSYLGLAVRVDFDKSNLAGS